MEILAITPDQQGTRIHAIGGIRFFNENWMSMRTSYLFDDLASIDERDSHESYK